MRMMVVVLMVMKKSIGTNRWWMVLMGRVQLLRVVVDGGDSDESGGWSGWSWGGEEGKEPLRDHSAIVECSTVEGL